MFDKTKIQKDITDIIAKASGRPRALIHPNLYFYDNSFNSKKRRRTIGLNFNQCWDIKESIRLHFELPRLSYEESPKKFCVNDLTKRVIKKLEEKFREDLQKNFRDCAVKTLTPFMEKWLIDDGNLSEKRRNELIQKIAHSASSASKQLLRRPWFYWNGGTPS